MMNYFVLFQGPEKHVACAFSMLTFYGPQYFPWYDYSVTAVQLGEQATCHGERESCFFNAQPQLGLVLLIFTF